MSPTSVSASHVDPVSHNMSVTDGAPDPILERLNNYQGHGNNIKVVKIEKTIEPLGATVKVYKLYFRIYALPAYCKNWAF